MSRLKHDPESKPKHYIREWRKHRGLTLERLADRLDVTAGALSHLERGKSGYTQPMLERLAYALMCEPADLITRNPADPDGIWSIWEGLEPAERKQAIQVIKALKKTG